MICWLILIRSSFSDVFIQILIILHRFILFMSNRRVLLWSWYCFFKLFPYINFCFLSILFFSIYSLSCPYLVTICSYTQNMNGQLLIYYLHPVCCSFYLVTSFTIIFALIGMASQMDLQITFLGKTFGADIADEWFKSLMFSKMYQQTWLLRISFFAECTCKRLFFFMIK